MMSAHDDMHCTLYAIYNYEEIAPWLAWMASIYLISCGTANTNNPMQIL